MTIFPNKVHLIFTFSFLLLTSKYIYYNNFMWYYLQNCRINKVIFNSRFKKVIKAVLCSKHVFNPFTHNKRKYLNCQTICFATKLKCQHDSVTKQQQGMQTIYKV